MTIEQIVELPASHRLVLEVPREIPAGRVILTFTPASSDLLVAGKAKSRAARQKLRELCKDSTLTVESFLAMKQADRVLETTIDERSGNNAP
ncbi:hypothetical protein FACS1894200_06010 [Spirochaetia bacterium]|nr:hypothetical protein FACS1894200_06010 [Spirochaetia bacterium]